MSKNSVYVYVSGVNERRILVEKKLKKKISKTEILFGKPMMFFKYL